jgi:hypothetical protein
MEGERLIFLPVITYHKFKRQSAFAPYNNRLLRNVKFDLRKMKSSLNEISTARGSALSRPRRGTSRRASSLWPALLRRLEFNF